jgi:small-conductance mechanosensitive channel
MAIGFAIAVDQVGIDLTALFAAGALFAVGLGFAMQNIAQNFVSGLILLIERAIKPGDILQVEGEIVRVRRMGIRSTVARTRNDEEIIIPNSILAQSLVKNFTLGDPSYRVRVGVGVSYDSDMRLVRATLERIAAEQGWRLESSEPVILLSEFGNSSVDWEVSVWSDDAWAAPRNASQLREGIWNELKAEGIVIAFPQLDLHFDPPIEAAFSKLPRSA